MNIGEMTLMGLGRKARQGIQGIPLKAQGEAVLDLERYLLHIVGATSILAPVWAREATEQPPLLPSRERGARGIWEHSRAPLGHAP